MIFPAGTPVVITLICVINIIENIVNIITTMLRKKFSLNVLINRLKTLNSGFLRTVIKAVIEAPIVKIGKEKRKKRMVTITILVIISQTAYNRDARISLLNILPILSSSRHYRMSLSLIDFCCFVFFHF